MKNKILNNLNNRIHDLERRLKVIRNIVDKRDQLFYGLTDEYEEASYRDKEEELWRHLRVHCYQALDDKSLPNYEHEEFIKKMNRDRRRLANDQARHNEQKLQDITEIANLIEMNRIKQNFDEKELLKQLLLTINGDNVKKKIDKPRKILKKGGGR